MVSKSANKPTRSQPARFLSRTANLGPWLALGFYDRGFYDTEDYCMYHIESNTYLYVACVAIMLRNCELAGAQEPRIVSMDYRNSSPMVSEDSRSCNV